MEIPTPTIQSGTTFLNRELYVKDLPGWCQNHSKGGVYAHDTIRPAIREKIPTQCQGLYDAAQKLRKTVYLCDSHVQDPNLYDSSLLRIFQ